MPKTILLTGATDGIGLVTAKMLAQQGHTLLIHGRSEDKLSRTQASLEKINPSATIKAYRADLSDLEAVEQLAEQLLAQYDHIDVLINNAGILNSQPTITSRDLDIRFVVNTLAPYVLTQRLMPILNNHSRVLNLSSAAQSPVDLEAMAGKHALPDMAAYAQSKLAITMWNNYMAHKHGKSGPIFIAINPGSLLDTKMVQEAFGRTNGGADIGANLLVRAALDDKFAKATGMYFDNDAKRFNDPHPDALDVTKNNMLVARIKQLIDWQN